MTNFSLYDSDIYKRATTTAADWDQLLLDPLTQLLVYVNQR